MPDLVRLRNITSDDLDVAPVGRVVRADGVVDVPRDIYTAHAWPETVWRVESTGTPGTSSSSTTTPGAAPGTSTPAAGSKGASS